MTPTMRTRQQRGLRGRRWWRRFDGGGGDSWLSFRGRSWNGGGGCETAEPLADVATCCADEAGGERDRHPEQDRQRDLAHVTSPVVVEHPVPGCGRVDPVSDHRRYGAEQGNGRVEGEVGGDGRGGV